MLYTQFIRLASKGNYQEVLVLSLLDLFKSNNFLESLTLGTLYSVIPSSLETQISDRLMGTPLKELTVEGTSLEFRYIVLQSIVTLEIFHFYGPFLGYHPDPDDWRLVNYLQAYPALKSLAFHDYPSRNIVSTVTRLNSFQNGVLKDLTLTTNFPGWPECPMNIPHLILQGQIESLHLDGYITFADRNSTYRDEWICWMEEAIFFKQKFSLQRIYTKDPQFWELLLRIPHHAVELNSSDPFLQIKYPNTQE